ncbi:hypothetical protein CCMSSC00406_0009271 [Pleurotus cornucopiae]|uniref:Uncharacterized protein n=1 Tax=Pleurotus cornucopiae TaxID=5321 RepID=A0ACB7J003_PLECO|nr:hypothetical protein CCMSSC00406_0009271 [Pleurotus cornucopiae]
MIVLSIGKHEFKPQQLGKLIPSVNAKATTMTYTLEDSALHAMDTTPIKDLPNFSSFMRALGVYFQILYRDEPPIKSTLVYSQWAHYLVNYPDSKYVLTLLHIIQYGAAIGFAGNDKPQMCRNLKTAVEHPDVINKDMDILCNNGRINGPFSSPPHPAVINHLSWPPGNSINDGILDSKGHIVYKAVSQAIITIRCLGRSSLLAKLDLKDAFRHIPLHAADYHLISCFWDGAFYKYLVLIFELKSAPYIFNLFAEGLHWMIQCHIPAELKHYLDNFLPIFAPDTLLALANDAVTWMQALGNSLGLMFQPEKTVWPTTHLEFLGIKLDTDAMEAQLPSDKLAYLKELLDAWSTKTTCNLHELQGLTGFLHFVSQVISYSHAFLRRLIQFSTTFSTPPHSCHHIPRYACCDLRWWSTYASSWNGITLIDTPSVQHHVFTDASSTKGLGGVFNNHWFSTRVPRRFRGSKRDIQFKELYAILQVILRWGHLWQHSHVHFHVDNQAVVAALSDHTNRSPHLVRLLQLILMLAAAMEFHFASSWLSSSNNALADAASRFQYSRLFSLAPNLDMQPSSVNPRTLGIKQTLSTHDLSCSISGTVSRPALGPLTVLVKNCFSNSFGNTQLLSIATAPASQLPNAASWNGPPTLGHVIFNQ